MEGKRCFLPLSDSKGCLFVLETFSTAQVTLETKKVRILENLFRPFGSIYQLSFIPRLSRKVLSTVIKAPQCVRSRPATEQVVVVPGGGSLITMNAAWVRTKSLEATKAAVDVSQCGEV